MRVFSSVLALLLLALPASHAAEPVSLVITECVGHYAVGLPGEVEVALTPLPAWKSGIVASDNYQDGAASLFSFLDVASFGLRVSHDMSSEEFRTVSNEIKGEYTAFKETNREKYLAYDTQADNAFAYVRSFGSPQRDESESTLDLYILEGAHAVHVLARGGTDQVRQTAKRIVTQYRARADYEIPNQSGYCLPHGFLPEQADDEGSSIGVAMRLKDHPDVEIFFAESTSDTFLPKVDSLPEEDVLRFFWEYQYASLADEMRTLTKPAFPKVSLAGRQGRFTFVSLHRTENEDERLKDIGVKEITDYGYLAVVKGDPKDLKNKPHLMLYVIRNASRAGKAVPVDKDELKRMAESIASSIQRRPG